MDDILDILSGRSRDRLTKIFIVGLLAIAPLTLLNGWVIRTVWNWFVPNIFPSLSAPSLGEAIGISLVASALTYTDTGDSEAT